MTVTLNQMQLLPLTVIMSHPVKSHESEDEVTDSQVNIPLCEHGEDNEVEEEEAEETEEEDSQQRKRYFYGKNRFKWSTKEPAKNVRIPAINKIRLPAARVIVADKTNPSNFFDKLFTEEMFQLLLTWANKKLDTMRLRYQRSNRPGLYPLNLRELTAFLGSLLYSAIFKSNNEGIRSIFATDGTGREIFRLVMSEERFQMLLSALRFDNPEDREERKKNNPTAAIGQFF
jgi:uncharacterized Zn finger protein (UPF0148 family)